MASQFQNRLVGVTILVACVVIFLPSIIDGKKTTYEDEFVATPIKPLLKEHNVVAQQTALARDLTASATAVTQAAASETAIENNQWQIQEVAESVTTSSPEDLKAEEKPRQTMELEKAVAVATAAVPESAWTIQLGAFQNAENINILLKKLHKAGFQAHTVPTEVIDGELTRVFVGPNVSKQKLETQLPQLQRLTKLQGKLIPFNAVTP